MPVYGASFIRERRIVLEAEVLNDLGTLPLIVAHEIFHFVWARLGNRRRGAYTGLLRREWERGARGELGESSSLKKGLLSSFDSRAVRDYVCESFCDTAAAIYSGVEASDWFTLTPYWRKQRERWFRATFQSAVSC